MDKNEIKIKIESMLEYLKDSAKISYKDDKTYVKLDAKIDILEDVLELFK